VCVVCVFERVGMWLYVCSYIYIYIHIHGKTAANPLDLTDEYLNLCGACVCVCVVCVFECVGVYLYVCRYIYIYIM